MSETIEGKVADFTTLLTTGTAVIDTARGKETVPALTHPDLLGLAVTMGAFGDFSVTHLPTGRSIFSGFERAVNAIWLFARLAQMTKTYNVDWCGDFVAEMKRVAGENMPRDPRALPESHPYTVYGWFEFIKTTHAVGGEFPWEEESPWANTWDVFVAAGLAPAGEAAEGPS